MSNGSWTLVAALLAGVACTGDFAESGEPQNGSTITVTDSGGIRIVQVDFADVGEILGSIDTNRQTVIGERTSDERYEFSNAIVATRLSGGQIAAAAWGESSVRLYDRNGIHLRTVGRPGQGPGEFEGIKQLCRLNGDSIVVRDQQRLSVFDAEGAFAYYAPIAPRADLLCPITDTLFTLEPVSSSQLSDDQAADGRPHVRLASFVLTPGALQFVTQVGIFVARDRSLRVQLRDSTGRPTGTRMLDPPFGRMTAFAPHGSQLHVGDGSTFSITTLTPRAEVGRILRVSVPLRLVDAALRDSYRDENLSGLSANLRRARDEVFSNAAAYPPFVPAFRDLRSDPEGRLWVQRYPLSVNERSHWLVLAGDGQPLGTVLVPGGLYVIEFGSDYLLAWTRRTDAAGVIYQLRSLPLRTVMK